MDKIDSMHEQMGNGSREMETLRKPRKKMIELKNTKTEIKNAFDGLRSRLKKWRKESVSLKTCQKKTSQTEME